MEDVLYGAGKLNIATSKKRSIEYDAISAKYFLNTLRGGSNFTAIIMGLQILSDQRQLLLIFLELSSRNLKSRFLTSRIRKDLSASSNSSINQNLIFKSQFIELFGDPETNPFGWRMGTIRDIVSDVRYGSSRKASIDGKYPYLRMNNITYGGELDLTDVKRIDIPDDEIDRCSVRKGDVLFNRTNSKELVGKTCLYDREELMVLAGFVIRVRVNEKAIPEFLAQYMNLPYTKELLLSMCKAACGQANINAQELQNIPIYIPPVEAQKQFVGFKEQLDKSKYVAYQLTHFLNKLIKYKLQSLFQEECICSLKM